MIADRLPEKLHYLLTRQIVETGYAPDIRELSTLAGIAHKEAEEGLRQLEKMHGIVLVPNSLAVWSLHPFSLLPTQFWVRSRRGGWWANCAWCSLGIGAALHEDVTVSSSDGAEEKPLEFRVESGRASTPNLLMHFPYPPMRWWDNPYCPCGNILFFSSKAAIDAWCIRHGHPKGSILAVSTTIALAERWFGDYASRDWHRKTPDEARSIFEDLNLDRRFWDIAAGFV